MLLNIYHHIEKFTQKYMWILPFLVMLVSFYLYREVTFFVSLGIVAVIFYTIYLYNDLSRGIFFLLFLTFFLNGMSRYLYYYGVGLPYGFSVDIVLILLLLIYFIKYRGMHNWKRLNNSLILLWALWFIFEILQLGNPYMAGFETWLINFRAEAFYVLLFLAIAMLVFDKYKYVKRMLIMWAVFSSLAAIKGLIQLVVGLDPVEHAFVMGPAFETHMLFGKLRVFSFLSDAGIFGASQAQICIVAGIMVLEAKDKKERLLFLITFLLTAIGTSISGTRGALIIPVVGGIIYLILKRNFVYLTLGLTVLFLVFAFFKYTMLLQNVYQVNRMRTALNPENPSLNVRLQNQKKFAAYLADKPFGAGIGSVGNQAMKKLPNSPIASIPTDSWYVRIWVQTGVIGIVFYISMLLWIMIKGWIFIRRVENIELKSRLIAIYSGIAGMLVASYGNQIFGQHPISLYSYCGLAFLYLSPIIDAELNNRELKQ